MAYVIIALAIVVLAGLVVHKRMLYRPKAGGSGLRSFVMPALLYFLPASLVWAWLVHTATYFVAVSDPWPPLVGLVGVCVLADLLLKNEIMALKRNE